MNFTDAVRESIGRFLERQLTLSEIQKTQETPIRFTPDYMDELEEELEDMPEVEDETKN